MATVRGQITAHDVVALREQVGAWPAGTSGTVVSEHGDVKLIEVSDDEGTTLDLIRAPVAKLDIVRRTSSP
jgi:hypothetical protein